MLSFFACLNTSWWWKQTVKVKREKKSQKTDKGINFSLKSHFVYFTRKKSIHPIWDTFHVSALRHYLNEAGKYNPQRLPVSFVGIVELRKHHKLDKSQLLLHNEKSMFPKCDSYTFVLREYCRAFYILLCFIQNSYTKYITVRKLNYSTVTLMILSVANPLEVISA